MKNSRRTFLITSIGVASTLALSRATRSKVDAFGLELDMTGQNGHSAPFSWQN